MQAVQIRQATALMFRASPCLRYTKSRCNNVKLALLSNVRRSFGTETTSSWRQTLILDESVTTSTCWKWKVNKHLQLDAAQCKTYQPAAAHGLRTLTGRNSAAQLCKLRTNGITYKVRRTLMDLYDVVADQFRLAHRLRDLQNLPYVVIRNDNMSHVYDLYYKAFDVLRRMREVKTVEENDEFCKVVKDTLREHLSVIPRLVSGVLETQESIEPEATDLLMSTLLRSRISRRVIAEQHLALTETFHSPWHFPEAKTQNDNDTEIIGSVFLRCNANEVVQGCTSALQILARQVYGPEVKIPEVKVQGDLKATMTYIPSHLEYIVGELLRNSMQAVIEHNQRLGGAPPPIEVLICETAQHVIFRISDQGGGIPPSILPYLWSFVKGPRREIRLKNLNQVPKLSATFQDLKSLESKKRDPKPGQYDLSLASFTSRPPNLRLGIGLPMSKVYAEYWAGSLELHSLEGYGVDTFLQISKLGNKNEQLSTRASMDAL